MVLSVSFAFIEWVIVHRIDMLQTHPPPSLPVLTVASPLLNDTRYGTYGAVGGSGNGHSADGSVGQRDIGSLEGGMNGGGAGGALGGTLGWFRLGWGKGTRGSGSGAGKESNEEPHNSRVRRDEEHRGEQQHLQENGGDDLLEEQLNETAPLLQGEDADDEHDGGKAADLVDGSDDSYSETPELQTATHTTMDVSKANNKDGNNNYSNEDPHATQPVLEPLAPDQTKSMPAPPSPNRPTTSTPAPPSATVFDLNPLSFLLPDPLANALGNTTSSSSSSRSSTPSSESVSPLPPTLKSSSNVKLLPKDTETTPAPTPDLRSATSATVTPPTRAASAPSNMMKIPATPHISVNGRAFDPHAHDQGKKNATSDNGGNMISAKGPSMSPTPSVSSSSSSSSSTHSPSASPSRSPTPSPLPPSPSPTVPSKQPRQNLQTPASSPTSPQSSSHSYYSDLYDAISHLWNSQPHLTSDLLRKQSKHKFLPRYALTLAEIDVLIWFVSGREEDKERVVERLKDVEGMVQNVLVGVAGGKGLENAELGVSFLFQVSKPSASDQQRQQVTQTSQGGANDSIEAAPGATPVSTSFVPDVRQQQLLWESKMRLFRLDSECCFAETLLLRGLFQILMGREIKGAL
jgi:hypothetical protein